MYANFVSSTAVNKVIIAVLKHMSARVDYASLSHNNFIMDQQALGVEALMLQVLNSGDDHTAMKSAETQLKSFLGTKHSAAILASILERSQNEVARQMAGVFLRKKIVTFWNKQNPAGKTAVKSLLIGRLAAEPSRPVRKAVISCVAALAKAIMPGGNWPEVLVLLDHAMKQQSDDVRELGMLLLLELTDALGRRITEFSAHVRGALAAGLSGQSTRVRVAALRTIALLLTKIDSEKAQAAYADLFLPMMSVTAWCLGGADPSPSSHVGGAGAASASSARGIVVDEQAAVLVFEAVSELVDEGSSLITPHYESVFRSMLSVVSNDILDDSTRGSAAQVLHSIIRAKPKWIVKRGLIEVMLPPLFELLLQFDPEEEAAAAEEAREAGVETADYTDMSVWTIAARLLDDLSISVAEKALFKPLMDRVAQWTASPDWKQRRAAVVVVGVCAEGCTGVMQEHLPQVLDLMLRHSSDPSEPVRAGLCHALALMSDHLLPRIVKFHGRVLPVIFQMLGDTSDTVVEEGCHVLECFCDNMSPEQMMPYLQPMMTGISQLLSKPGQSLAVQENLLTATASAAASSGKLFLPYFGGVIISLLTMMQQTDDRLLRLRCRATRCVGQVALAVGAEAMGPYVSQAISSAVEGMNMDSLELEEHTFLFFGAMAQVFGAHPEFSAIVPQLIDMLLLKMASTDGMYVRGSGLDDDEDGIGELADDLAAGHDGDEGDDGDHAAGDSVNIRISTAFMEVKAAAVDCLGLVAGHCGGAIGPQIEKIAEALFKQCSHFHETVKYAAVHALINVVRAYADIYPPQNGVMHERMRQVYDHFLTQLIQMMKQEPDKETVAHCCATIAEWCALLGPSAVNRHADAVMDSLVHIMQGKTVCQLEDDDEGAAGVGESNHHFGGGDEDDEDPDAEHDHVLMDECTDCVIAVAKALGPQSFAPFLGAVVRELVRFSKRNRPDIDRLMAIGCFGELVDVLGENGFAGCVGLVIPRVLDAIKSHNRELQRNCAYCIGVLISKCPLGCQPSLQQMLTALQPLFALTRGHPEDDYVIDNAAAALCRAITTLPDSIPAAAALPAILGVMPVRADHAEHATTYGCILWLLSIKRAPEARAQLPRILALCADALAPSVPVPEAVQQSIVASLSAYSQSVRAAAASGDAAAHAEGQALATAIAGLQPQQQQLLAQCFR